MGKMHESNLRAYKESAIIAAKDFEYPKETIASIRAAKSESSVSAIMARARKNKFG